MSIYFGLSEIQLIILTLNIFCKQPVMAYYYSFKINSCLALQQDLQ